MLVLTRRAGESIMIGSDVAVRVIEVRGDVVRLGVDAPREVQVHREEVFNAVRAQNLAAASAGAAGADVLRAGLAGRLAARLRPASVTSPGAAPTVPAPPARPADGPEGTGGSGAASSAVTGPAAAGAASAPRPVLAPPRPGPHRPGPPAG